MILKMLKSLETKKDNSQITSIHFKTKKWQAT